MVHNASARVHQSENERPMSRSLCVVEQVELIERAGAGCAWIAAKTIVHCGLKMKNVLFAESPDAEGIVRYHTICAGCGLYLSILGSGDAPWAVLREKQRLQLRPCHASNLLPQEKVYASC
eukprot:6272613-Amphidinium_carterae.1